MEPSIGVVIVNYNGINYQNECIRSIRNMNYTNYQIIVVDSGSTDGSIEALESEFEGIHVLRQNENVGVAKGNNIGILYSRKLGMDYTLLLNNDVEVDSSLLTELVKYANCNTVTVPKIYIYNQSNKFWFAGGYLDWKIGTVVHKGENEIDNGQYDTIENITYAPTCCMLIRNTIFDIVGMMDENVFMYFDDTDYCVRFGENDISILYVPTAKLWHKVSSSTGGKGSKIQTYYIKRNQLYYIDKYKKYIKPVDKLMIIIKDFIRGVLSIIWRKNNRMIWSAYWDYFHGRMGRKIFK